MKNIRKLLFISLILIAGCGDSADAPDSGVIDYSQTSAWAYFPADAARGVDVFFVAPTVFFGDDSTFNMELDDEQTKANFVGAVNMEKGIYDDCANFYAPFYRQASLSCFEIRGFEDQSEEPAVRKAFETAESDVRDAFDYYLQTSARPFILAGFSQGAEMIIKLMKSEFNDENLRQRLIAAYIIGGG